MFCYKFCISKMGFPWWLSGKESVCQCRRCRFNSWVRKIPWERKWQPSQYSCLGNCMDRGAWQSSEQALCAEVKWSESHSVVSDSVTAWVVAGQSPLSMEFSRPEYRSGSPFPSPGDLPNPGIEPRSSPLWADSLLFEPQGSPQSLQLCLILCSPTNCSPSGSSVHGILLVRMLEWIARPSSKWSS